MGFFTTGEAFRDPGTIDAETPNRACARFGWRSP